MLEAIGISSVEELFAEIPAELRLDQPLDLPAGESESEVFDRLAALARRNADADSERCFIGAGLYDPYTPARIDQTVDGQTVLDLTVQKTNTYNPYILMPVPESAQKAAGR